MARCSAHSAPHCRKGTSLRDDGAEVSEAAQRPDRPWTVIALIVLGILGTLWNLAFEGWELRNLFGTALAIVFAWGLWTGQRWAYWLTFAGALLSGVILAIFVFSGSTLVDTVNKVIWFVNVVVTIFLLWHPATRRFIGLDKDPTAHLVNDITPEGSS